MDGQDGRAIEDGDEPKGNPIAGALLVGFFILMLILGTALISGRYSVSGVRLDTDTAQENQKSGDSPAGADMLGETQSMS